MGPRKLLEETDELLQKTIDAYKATPATSPLETLRGIMHQCHDAFRVLILRLGQHSLDQGTLLEAFDRVISRGGIHLDHKDRWISNTTIVTEQIVLKYPKLKTALLTGIEGDRLLREDLRNEVIAEIKAILERCEAPTMEEVEPDPWNQAVAGMTQQQLPLGPGQQPVYNPPLMPPKGTVRPKKGTP